MKPAVLMILVLAAAPFASGCIGSSSKTEPAPSPGALAPAASGEIVKTENLGPAANESSAPQTPDTETRKGQVVVSVTGAMAVFTFRETNTRNFQVLLEEGVTGIVVEAAWSPSTPLSESMRLDVARCAERNPLPADGCFAEPVAEVAGRSPLHIAIPVKELGRSGEYSVGLKASGDPIGAALLQDFDLHFTIFRGIPFDANFTAMRG